MANVTDPLVNSLSGSDPQNLLEYITRQRIYDTRYWKEECFGLTVTDVLTKSAEQLVCVGDLPTKCLSLLLKLLQLHPEIDLIVESFIEQEDFKYVRALGALYVRMNGRPIEIYEALEPLYGDYRKLRVWNSVAMEWSILHMDEWVHSLLSDTRIIGITLPRLPQRAVLQEAGYLPEGPRDTPLQATLTTLSMDPGEYLKYKANETKSPAAIAAWEQRCERLSNKPKSKNSSKSEASENSSKNSKPAKKKAKYGSLFKNDDNPGPSKCVSQSKIGSIVATNHDATRSDEYWDEERARLGLKPLKR